MADDKRTVKQAAGKAAVSWFDWMGSRKTKHALVGSALVIGAFAGGVPTALVLTIAGLWGVAGAAQGIADHGQPRDR